MLNMMLLACLETHVSPGKELAC